MAGQDQLGLNFAFAPQRRIWSVRDLMASVRTSLEREFGDVWVEGEISNLRPAESGHLYFTLKDGEAQMRVVMFRSQARLLRFRPENGQVVIARGRLTVYEARGETQLLAEYLEPKGAGALQIAFEQLKAKLAAEGLFDAARKKPIPALPRRIGVVTSPRGAALQDILNVLRRRHENVNVAIFPAQVQGEAAPSEVSVGVRYFNRARNVDVILIARGGGSVEDLAAFNHEGLARTIAASDIPVISAVGHETDFTICDFVADLRAPTPSAAAELVIRSKQEWEERLAGLHQRLGNAARYRLALASRRLTQLAQHGAFARIMDALGRRQQRLDDLIFRLRTTEQRRIDQYRRRLDVAAARLRHQDISNKLNAMQRELARHGDALAEIMRRRLMQRRSRWERAAASLEALSPVAILERGYALVFDAQGNVIRDAAQVDENDEIRARLAKGEIAAIVKARHRKS